MAALSRVTVKLRPAWSAHQAPAQPELQRRLSSTNKIPELVREKNSTLSWHAKKFDV